MAEDKIQKVTGRCVPVRGDDIDTDRIVPARYLRCVTFEGIEEHVFEDDRRAFEKANKTFHPFDDPRYRGATILLVNRNFGCGSSREHAPQALKRWGIRAVAGESFAEIFFGNCVALGVPCLTVSRDDIERLLKCAEDEPNRGMEVDLEKVSVSTPDFSVDAGIPPGIREAFLRGTWDATGLLLERFEEVEAVARKLPYVAGF